MGLMSKIKHHAKRLIGKGTPKDVAEKVVDHVEKVEKHVKKGAKKVKGLVVKKKVQHKDKKKK